MASVIEEYRKQVGRRIKQARESLPKEQSSHDKLAERIGTSRQHLIKLEKGTHLARKPMLAKIAAETGTTVEWLEQGSSEDEDEEAEPDLQRAFSLFVDLLGTLNKMGTAVPGITFEAAA